MAITAILSAEAMSKIGDSVGVGIGSSIGLSILCAFLVTNKIVSPRVFGIAGAVIAQALAVGLFTGAIKAFEEVHDLTYHEETPEVYNIKDSEQGVSLQILSFLGVNGKFTAVSLTGWLLSILILTFIQV